MFKKTMTALTGLLAFGYAEVATAADVEWKASLWGKRRAFTEHLEKISEYVAEKTDGKFKITLYYGGSLSKPRENLDVISFGAFEMAQFCASYHADKNPTLTVLELPMLPINDLETQIRVDQAVYAHPAVKADMARWNVDLLMSTPMPQYNFIGTGDAPEKLEDFDGMRVRALGGVGKAMSQIGAVPTTVTASEAYTAIEAGAVQAVSFAPHAHMAFKTVEVGNWFTTNLNPGTVSCPVVVNTAALEALPEEYRRILDEAVPVAYDHYVESYKKVYDKFYPALDERKIQRITYTEAELERFYEKARKPVWDEWLAEMNEKGIPGQELIDLVLNTAKSQ